MAGSGSIIMPSIKQLQEKDHASISNIDYSSIRGKVCLLKLTFYLTIQRHKLYIIQYNQFQSVLVSPSEDQYELLLRRLKERIQGGGSETIFDIGIGEGILFNVIFFMSNCIYFYL